MRPMTCAERQIVALVHAGDFEIDEQGRIWRRAVRGRPVARRRGEHDTGTYLMVRAMTGGARVQCMAHRLVWQFLHGDIPDGMVINHRNGMKTDNRPANLEVVSYSDNLRHAHALGLIDQTGIFNPAAKLTDDQVREIRRRRCAGEELLPLAHEFGVSFQYVSRLVRGNARRLVRGAPLTLTDGRSVVRMDRDTTTGQFVGKHAAGRLLDGVQHDGIPEVSGAR